MNNWMAIIVSVCFANMMLAIFVLAHIINLMEEVGDLRKAVDDNSCMLEKPWADNDLKYLKVNNMEKGEVKGEWV